MGVKRIVSTRSRVWKSIKHIPRRIIQYFRIKLYGSLYSEKLLKHYVSLDIPKPSIAVVKQKLAMHLKSSHSLPPAWTTSEKQIIERIQKQTESENRNNITRTQAYYEIYKQFPELHWAFLAHMVSRNGGWSMTDIKGDLIPKLMNNQQSEYLFLFLERANSFIFHDAYPQLLLYAESKKKRKNMFHLLRAFHVSSWMQVIWEYVWKHPHPSLLTTALIINEQNYIEHRVVQDPLFKQNVLDELYFKTQAIMQLNQIVFPIQDRLVGLIMEDFTDLHERIEFGKKLYCILFGMPQIMMETVNFAEKVKHSGSRADYWPHLYAKKRNSLPSTSYTEKLKGCKLIEGAEPFYSPELRYAWKDRPVNTPQVEDWSKDLTPLNFLKSIKPPKTFEMTEEHCYGLNKIELAVLTKKKL